jgi:hypothetical protein
MASSTIMSILNQSGRHLIDQTTYAADHADSSMQNEWVISQWLYNEELSVCVWSRQ